MTLNEWIVVVGGMTIFATAVWFAWKVAHHRE